LPCGWKHGKVCQKNSHTYNHNHICGINMKKPIQIFLISLWSNGALHWVYSKLHTKCEEFSCKKNGWKIYFKLVRFSKFPTYFYMRTLINYDYDMKFLKTHWYILVLYPFESTKNSITIILSSMLCTFSTRLQVNISAHSTLLNFCKYQEEQIKPKV
jgi:hypothetical protein